MGDACTGGPVPRCGERVAGADRRPRLPCRSPDGRICHRIRTRSARVMQAFMAAWNAGQGDDGHTGHRRRHRGPCSTSGIRYSAHVLSTIFHPHYQAPTGCAAMVATGGSDDSICEAHEWQRDTPHSSSGSISSVAATNASRWSTCRQARRPIWPPSKRPRHGCARKCPQSPTRRREPVGGVHCSGQKGASDEQR